MHSKYGVISVGAISTCPDQAAPKRSSLMIMYAIPSTNLGAPVTQWVECWPTDLANQV